MTARDDLLALDEEALTRLTNRGLVRRAARALTEGPGPALELLADGTLIARHGDIETRLPAGVPLEESTCTCAARGMCRHRVLAVLAYRASTEQASPAAWSPGTLSDEALRAHLGAWPLRRATRRRAEGFDAVVHRTTGAPRVELPTCTVRFLVPDDVAYARCDCRRDRCAHVALAVWACREADARSPDGTRVTVHLGPREDTPTRALGEARALARELLIEGVEGSAGLPGRFARAATPLDEAGLRWPADVCAALERDLAGYAAREARYAPARLADLLTELEARARAAGGPAPARTVLGLGVPARSRLDELRLVSLGARVRAGDAEGDTLEARVDTYLADPDAGHVLVLRKRWRTERGELGAILARRSVLRGVTLDALARGQLVTRAAARRADREVTLATAGRADTSVTPQSGEWSRLGPTLCPPDLEALRAQLDDLPPALLAPRVLAERVRVVRVRQARRMGFEVATQTLHAELVGPSGGILPLRLVHDPARGAALDAAVSALEGGVRYVSGALVRRGGTLVVDPIAMVTDRVIVLDLADAAPGRLPATPPPAPPDPLHEALAQARATLDEAAHRGLRHLPPRWYERAAEAATRLEDLGLDRCAGQLRGLRDPSADAWMEASLRVRFALALAQ